MDSIKLIVSITFKYLSLLKLYSLNNELIKYKINTIQNDLIIRDEILEIIELLNLYVLGDKLSIKQINLIINQILKDFKIDETSKYVKIMKNKLQIYFKCPNNKNIKNLFNLKKEKEILLPEKTNFFERSINKYN